MFNVLDTVSNGVVTLTSEMKAVTDAFNKAQQEVNEAEKARNEITAKGKLAETGKSFVNLAGFNEAELSTVWMGIRYFVFIRRCI